MLSTPDESITRRNNFDLIRLAAASQVLVVHGIDYIGVTVPSALYGFVSRFPGVPVFFVISGFLISRSFERHSEILHYWRNRALRIYPALYACLAFSILTVTFSGYLHWSSVPPLSIARWLACQATVLQFERPAFLDGYATGTLNGSLWTIPIELQFYLILPFLYRFLGTGRRRNLLLVSLIVAFIGANIYRYGPVENSVTLGDKLFKLSFIPYVYMFLIGVFCQRNFDVVSPFLRGKAAWWLVAYVVVSYGTSYVGLRSMEFDINPLCVLFLSALTLSAAFTASDLGYKLLRGNDISYGVYIYHMPIANLLIYLSVGGVAARYALFIGLSVLVAAVSWRLVERPALRLKVDAMRTPEISSA